MKINERIESLIQLSENLQEYLHKNENKYPKFNHELNEVILKTESVNPWFTVEFQQYALQYWANHLTEEKLKNWLSNYDLNNQSPKRVGLVLAGNVPMVGFHDVLSVLLSGNIALIKPSSKDPYLIPFLLDFWKDLCPSLEFEWVEKLENFDKVIATGSNNTTQYFEQYFQKIPHIIRKNRTSIAVLNEKTTDEELDKLADDIFIYFGLGCRNVTQLFLPKDFELDRLFNAFLKYQHLQNSQKFTNSYDYYKAIYLLNKDIFWDNNFVLLKLSKELFAPVATVNFQYYTDLKEVKEFYSTEKENIQCVVGDTKDFPGAIAFGEAQNPELNTYADGVDVMKFLLEN